MAVAPGSVLALALSLLLADPTGGLAASPPPGVQHRIGIRTVDGVAEFVDHVTGQRFTPRGANHVFVPGPDGRVILELFKVGVYSAAQTRADFTALADAGYNTVRVFLDHCSSGPGCIGDDDGVGLNDAYLDNVADLLVAARETGLVVLLTSNDLPDQGGYAQEANDGSGADFGGYRNSYYLTPAAVSATRRYWRDLITGLKDRGAPLEQVLGWELVNEQWMFADQPPLSLREGMVTTTTGTYDMADAGARERMVADGVVHYIAEVRAEIRALDPDGLVTMGFFVPGLVAPGWTVETGPLLERAALDFFDFHLYPGHLSLMDHARAFGMIGHTRTPIVMGEVGAFRERYGTVQAAGRAVTEWVADSCALGFDGWLHWTHRPANPEIGDRTWSLTDEDGFLLKLLSPDAQPDSCVAADVPDPNLAFRARTRASAVVTSEPARQAVDGDEATIWNSGAGPTQWLEVRLDGRRPIAAIRLLVSQWPAGPTRHEIAIRRRDSDALAVVRVIAGRTRDGDWLTWRPDRPLRRVIAVRITTLESPSWVAWREVEVLSDVP
jgi:hypothetical protein